MNNVIKSIILCCSLTIVFTPTPVQSMEQSELIRDIDIVSCMSFGNFCYDLVNIMYMNTETNSIGKLLIDGTILAFALRTSFRLHQRLNQNLERTISE